jgi:hypothetical protein
VRYLKHGAGLILPLALIASFIVVPYFLKIDNLVCRSQFGLCSLPLEQKIEPLKGKSYREVRKNLKKLLSDDSTVDKFSYQLKLPSTVVINLIENKAEFGLKTPGSGQVALIDGEGRVIKVSDVSNLPAVSSDKPFPEIGGSVTAKELFALKLVRDLFSVYQIKEGELKNDTFTVRLPQGQTVIFPTEGDRELLMGSLSAIVSRLNGGTEDSTINVSVIDLRFKNPILK